MKKIFVLIAIMLLPSSVHAGCTFYADGTESYNGNTYSVYVSGLVSCPDGNDVDTAYDDYIEMLDSLEVEGWDVDYNEIGAQDENGYYWVVYANNAVNYEKYVEYFNSGTEVTGEQEVLFQILMGFIGALCGGIIAAGILLGM